MFFWVDNMTIRDNLILLKIIFLSYNDEYILKNKMSNLLKNIFFYIQ